jgi:hypothetical protein
MDFVRKNWKASIFYGIFLWFFLVETKTSLYFYIIKWY